MTNTYKIDKTVVCNLQTDLNNKAETNLSNLSSTGRHYVAFKGYDSTSTYSLNEVVMTIISDSICLYQSLVDSNTYSLSDTTKWKKVELGGGSSVNTDNATINKNTSNEIQTIAVKNRRDMSTLPIWHGTQAQWTNGELVNWCNWGTSAIVTRTLNNVSLTGSPRINGPVFFGNGVYVSGVYMGNYYYSTDGINWTSNSGVGSIYCFGAGKFIGVISGNFCYSTDGINWTATSANAYGPCCYAAGKFVFYGRGVCGYSVDGVNWVINSNQNQSSYQAVMYGNGVFVAIPAVLNAPIMYSTDGVNWNSTGTNLPYYPGVQGGYGQGYFVWPINTDESDYMGFMYSTDGINWALFNTPWDSTGQHFMLRYCSSIFYFSGNFYTIVERSGSYYFFIIYSIADSISQNDLVGYGIWYSGGYLGSPRGMYTTPDKIMLFTTTSSGIYLPYTQLSCLTASETPSIGDPTYSAPGTASQLTVASTTTGAIRLTDSNTYYRDSNGDQQTYAAIGDAHPEYLCFIDGVGVKKGNTLIADVSAI